VRCLLALAASAALAGCIQYADLPTEAGPPDPGGEPAYIHVGLMASAWMPDSLRVSAMLDTGRDGLGRRRAVADAGLRIGGATLLPTHGDPGTLYYAVSLPWREAAPEPLTIRFPRLSGVVQHPEDVRVVPATRIGPAAVVLPDTGALVLWLAPPDADAAVEVWWTLSLVNARGVLTVSRTGPPPERLSVPREVIPGEGAEPVEARFSYALETGRPDGSPEPEYAGRVSLFGEFHWTVLPPQGP
jgi:hypothetical protein